MIPVLHTDQIKKLDQLTVERQKISFDDLMERAGSACVNWILDKYPLRKKFSIFCGTGNNGGDGFVIARLLAERSKNINVFIPGDSTGSEGFRLNKERLEAQAKVSITEIIKTEDVIFDDPDEIIIDAIFGSGINRAPEG